MIVIYHFQFLQEKVPSEIRSTLMSSILRPQGPLLISTLVTASLFSLSSYTLPNVAEVLLEFMIVDREVNSFTRLFAY